jgi:hypothetical protein
MIARLRRLVRGPVDPERTPPTKQHRGRARAWRFCRTGSRQHQQGERPRFPLLDHLTHLEPSVRARSPTARLAVREAVREQCALRCRVDQDPTAPRTSTSLRGRRHDRRPADVYARGNRGPFVRRNAHRKGLKVACQRLTAAKGCTTAINRGRWTSRRTALDLDDACAEDAAGPKKAARLDRDAVQT